MTTKDGGPAFPIKYVIREPDRPLTVGDTAVCFGLSMRDYFAGQALIGILTQPDQVGNAATAKWCYAMADAMLVAREK